MGDGPVYRGQRFFLSSVGWLKAGAWCFVIGSLLFVLGAGINVLQIVKSSSIKILQLMNLTTITFVVGAVLFTVASVPYLWSIAAKSDRTTLYAFLAWQYLAGSVLFFWAVSLTTGEPTWSLVMRLVDRIKARNGMMDRMHVNTLRGRMQKLGLKKPKPQ